MGVSGKAAIFPRLGPVIRVVAERDHRVQAVVSARELNDNQDALVVADALRRNGCGAAEKGGDRRA